ncbi:MAG: hypothetical protein Q4C72_01920 [Eubacteriales bacterium]|nr:hypothetical protein [Eubacteriales bacterium]
MAAVIQRLVLAAAVLAAAAAVMVLVAVAFRAVLERTCMCLTKYQFRALRMVWAHRAVIRQLVPQEHRISAAAVILKRENMPAARTVLTDLLAAAV